MLEDLHRTGRSWTAIANDLGVGKQTLTGFRKRRSSALDAEAVLRLVTKYQLSLPFEEDVVSSYVPPRDTEVRVSMEFDDSFEVTATPTPAVVLTRKPPARVSFIGVRVERLRS